MASAESAQCAQARVQYEGLDALRGLAALLVVFNHIDNFYPTFLTFHHGYLGVDIFFMLSGFVIAYVYESRLASGHLSFGNYARIRLQRLYPMVVLSIFIGGAYAVYEGMTAPRVLFLIVAQLAMVPMLRAGGIAFPLNTPQWSLFYELALNAFHALVAKHLTTARVAAIAAISGVVFGLAIWYEGTASVGFGGVIGFAAGAPRALFGFFTGTLIYRVTEKREGARTRSASLGWLAYPALFAAVILPGLFKSVPQALADAVCVFLVFPLAVWGAAGLRLQGAWRSVASWSAVISYPLYAVQQPMIEFAAPLLPQVDALRPFAWIGLLTILCLLAWGIEVLIDAPVRRWFKGGRSLLRQGAASTAS